MINYKEIIQGSDEWHQLRWGKIGGTDSSGLFSKTETLYIKLLSEHLEEFEPFDSYESFDMVRGKELEPFAIEYLNSYTKLRFNTTGWLQCEENELLGISPDGITKCEKFACEIKCYAKKKHTEILVLNEIPLDDIYQCIHYFTVNPKLEKLFYISFRPESCKHFIKELTLDSMVNIGTNKTKVMETIGDAVSLSKKRAKELKYKIKNQVNNLKLSI